MSKFKVGDRVRRVRDAKPSYGCPSERAGYEAVIGGISSTGIYLWFNGYTMRWWPVKDFELVAAVRWIVWSPDTTPNPKVTHDSEAKAEAEAKRLSAQFPNKRFFPCRLGKGFRAEFKPTIHEVSYE